MRHLVTGTDARGRSCVVSEHDDGSSSDQMAIHTAYDTEVAPPPSSSVRSGELVDLGIAPGVARQFVTHWPPGYEADLHHTDTVDFDAVLAGSIELVLETGRFRLDPGDTVVVTGVAHGWATGAQGATTSHVMLGSPAVGD